MIPFSSTLHPARQSYFAWLLILLLAGGFSPATYAWAQSTPDLGAQLTEHYQRFAIAAQDVTLINLKLSALEKPTETQLLSDNDLKSALVPESHAGVLAYPSSGKLKGEKGLRFLALRSFYKAKDKTVIYSLKKELRQAYAPQFSPDGRYLLFKVGLVGYRYSTYRLYILDLMTNRLQAGPAEDLTYLRVLWSPDSRYIAYFIGGDIEGNAPKASPTKLCTFKLENSRSYFIAQDSALKTVSWTPDNKLFYSSVPQFEAKNDAEQTEGQKLTESRNTPIANLYQSPAEGGTSTLILENGNGPSVSPDGQWLAYFTRITMAEAKGARTAQKMPLLPYLCLFNLNDGKKFILRPSHQDTTHLRWTPDSKRLVIIKQTQFSPNAKAQVSAVEVPSLTIKDITVLEATDYKSSPRPNTLLQFEPIEVSPDSSFIYVRKSEFTEHHPILSKSVEVLTLQSVALENGAVDTLAKVKTSMGIDWYA